jgi:hypothetical protein
MNFKTPSHTERWSCSTPKAFFTRFFVRDRLQRPFISIECGNLREVSLAGDKMFRNFSGRNPWIFSDSVRGMAWVFLDPDTSQAEGQQ